MATAAAAILSFSISFLQSAPFNRTALKNIRVFFPKKKPNRKQKMDQMSISFGLRHGRSRENIFAAKRCQELDVGRLV